MTPSEPDEREITIEAFVALSPTLKVAAAKLNVPGPLSSSRIVSTAVLGAASVAPLVGSVTTRERFTVRLPFVSASSSTDTVIVPVVWKFVKPMVLVAAKKSTRCVAVPLVARTVMSTVEGPFVETNPPLRTTVMVKPVFASVTE